MRRELFVYLSGPITAKDGHSIEENVAEAMTVFFALLAKGIPCFVPHASAIFPSAWSAVPYEQWMEYDFAVIDRCTHVVMLERWETSKGAVLERNYATQIGVPVLSVEQALAGEFRNMPVARTAASMSRNR